MKQHRGGVSNISKYRKLWKNEQKKTSVVAQDLLHNTGDTCPYLPSPIQRGVTCIYLPSPIQRGVICI